MAVRQDASTGELVEDTRAGDKPLVAKQIVDILHVKVWSPFRVYFDGEAQSLSGVNATGPFDILARHRNFITLLDSCELIIRAPSGELRIRISGGVMQVHANVVKVFLEV